VVEAVVYGVAVPGTEGRAGAAALVVAPTFDLAALRQHLAERLPAYARPLFLRVRREIEKTATFKPLKHDLVRAGFDPALGDPVYVDDPERQAFVPLDATLYARIQTGHLRL
jgi:fatty-acyl-CoA synthase